MNVDTGGSSAGESAVCGTSDASDKPAEIGGRGFESRPPVSAQACQHVYDDDLLIGQQSRPGDLCPRVPRAEAGAPEPFGFHAQAGTRREGQPMTLTALPRSENRRKTHQVKVRLDDDDLAGLDRLCKANGITGPELLRLGLHRYLNEEGL